MIPLASVPMWVFAYAAIFAFLHLVVGYYFYRRSGNGNLESAGAATVTDGWTDSDGGTGTAVNDEQVVRCGHCGAANDSGFRYCGNCVRELPSSPVQPPSTSTPNGRESR